MEPNTAPTITGITRDEQINQDVAYTKELRVGLDAQLQRLKCGTRQSRERSLARTKVEEAIMWLGMDLKALNEMRLVPQVGPYPSSYDPKSPKVETPPDVKL